jgi:hypothetical protein
MTRFSAFGIHLGISLVIFAGLTYLVLFHWYPDLFFQTDGGWQGMRIIIAVDLVLGPALTLIVYRHGKPGLKFDLTCIGVFQALCLAAGVWIVYSERPLAMIYVDGQFTSVNAGTYENANMEVPDFSRFPGDWPKWVMVDVPEDVIEQADFRRQMFKAGKRLVIAVDRYVPFDPHAAAVTDDPYEPATLLERDAASQSIPQWLSRYGGTLEDYRFYPFGTRFNYVFLGFRANSSELIGILDTPAPA